MDRILIIKMTAIGDLFMALPHMDRIAAHYPRAQIRVLTSPPLAHLFAGHPRLRPVVLDRSRYLGGDSTWSRTLWVRRQQFDAVIDLQGNRTSRRLVRYSKAPLRAGTQPRKVYSHHPPNEYRRDNPMHVFTRLNETLASAGLPTAVEQTRLYGRPTDDEAIEAFKNKWQLQTGRFAILHAGSSADWPSKRWPDANYIKLATLLADIGLPCVWVGGSDDAPLNRRLSASIGIDATGQFSLLQLYLLGRSAKLALGNDSGPMHILAASGIPVFSFFGPTDWRRTHAIGQRKRVFTHPVACSPCFKGQCPPDRRHACLRTVSPETVFHGITVNPETRA